MSSFLPRAHLAKLMQALARSAVLARWKARARQWREQPFSGTLTVLFGILLCTACIWGIDTLLVVLPNPGLLYLPLVGMLAYHWGGREALAATLLQLLCVYVFFLPPPLTLKSLAPQATVQLVTLVAVTGFVLALVQLARHGRTTALREAARLSALNRVGRALTGELEETRLLHLIADIAHDLTGAEFAAFVLRPADVPGSSPPPS
jgi:K+-sensing histidine kinase KdpD